MKCRQLILGLAAVVLGQCIALPVFSASEKEEYDHFETDAKACIVLDAQTGRILGGHNIHDRLPMASTTKIMGAMIALEQPNLDDYFTVDPKAIRVEGSSMGLLEGDQVTLRSLVYGMMLPSGNDAANAAAVRISGSVEEFVEEMNQRAGELGLCDTHFVTPSGLDAPEHYSTAYDMAVLTAKAMENEAFCEICSLSDAQVRFGNPPYNRWLKNYNKLLTRYPHCIGVKTGFTDNAYRCLVSAAEKGGTRLICVTLNCADDWGVHEVLYEKYFEELKVKSFEKFFPKSLPLGNVGLSEGGSRLEQVEVTVQGSPNVSVRKGEKLTCEVLAQPLLLAPIEKGQVLGEMQYYLNGKPWFSKPIVANERVLSSEVHRKGLRLIDRMREFIIQLF